MATSEQKIPNDFPINIYGPPFYLESGSLDTTPGIQQTLVSHTVADKDKKLHQLIVTTATMGKFELFLGPTLIASGILGAGQNNEKTFWTPPRPILIGQVIQLKYHSLQGRPVDKVEAYLMFSEIEE